MTIDLQSLLGSRQFRGFQEPGVGNGRQELGLYVLQHFLLRSLDFEISSENATIVSPIPDILFECIRRGQGEGYKIDTSLPLMLIPG
jgi:hypothetical protein